ncbi:DUF2726 domain-containing protein [Massilia sp. DWR3-1-1]|uniref:DUF2726 domain-containing protein n=1 Tax=Massilia sp. DWR3-1-1 TaxID=2804559 RepID=UPI003CF4FD8B
MDATVLLIIVATLVVAFLLPLLGKRGGGAAPAFKARPFMSANEAEFLARLESAVPEYRFHAQVAMGALLDPLVARQGNNRAWWKARNMFNQKIIDYVAQRRYNGQIVAIIELDDRTHDSVRDARRDAMLQQAGYRTVRWQSKTKPNRAEILATLVVPPAPPGGARAALPVLKTPGTSVRGELWGKSTGSASKP